MATGSLGYKYACESSIHPLKGAELLKKPDQRVQAQPDDPESPPPDPGNG